MQVYSHSKQSPLHLDETQPRARDNIRILKLFPGAHGADLEGNILIQPIREEHVKEGPVEESLPAIKTPVPYEALSYSWGPRKEGKWMKIVADSQSYKIGIQPNLDAALRQLRYESVPRCLWVDAICIDQSNEAEKSQQIPQMSWIYSRASSVAVWLGQEEHRSGRAMGFVREFLELDNFDHLVRDSLNSKDWAALSELLRRPWFSRRWIIQEIAVSRAATLYCGKDSIPWRDFADGISLFASKRHELRELFRDSSAHSHHPDYLGELSEIGAVRLVYAADNLFRKTGQGVIMEHLFSLESLMSSMSAFEASAPHDILYAIIWLANDASPVDPRAPLAQGIRPSFFSSPLPTPLNSPTAEGGIPRTGFPFTSPAEPTSNGTFTVSGSETFDSPKHNVSDSDRDTGDAIPGATETAMPDLTLDGPQQHEDTNAVPSSSRQPWALKRMTSRRNSISQKQLQNLLVPIQKHLDKKRLTSPGNPRAHSAVHIAGDMFKDALTSRRIYVDYSKSVFEVCKDFLEFVIKKSESLDMICRPWAPDDPSLPSWVPVLSRGAFAPTVRRVHRRVHADPLVGEPGNGMKPYRASSGLRAKWDLESDGQTLIVRGFELDLIAEKCLPASAGIIPLQWMQKGGWKDSDPLPPDGFWRTLVGNRTIHGKRPPSHWQRICAEAFRRRPKRGDLNTTEVILYDCPSVVREYLERVQCVVWSRRLALLESLGDSLALVPAAVKKGDRICILDGCSVPVVLRKFVDGQPAAKKFPRCADPNCPSRRGGGGGGKAGSGKTVHRHHGGPEVRVDTAGAAAGVHFEVVGEAYVHGMMDGEAFSKKQERKISQQTFRLR